MGDSLPLRLGRTVNFLASRYLPARVRVINRPLRNWLLARASGPSVCTTPLGFRVLVDPSRGEVLEQSIWTTGAYELGTLRVMRKCLRRGDVFIDVGSNIGMMTLEAARAVGPSGAVWAFEPAPATHAILRQNVEMNGFGNISALQTALGSERGDAMFYFSPDHLGQSSFIEPQVGGQEIRVPIQTLDEVMSRESVDSARMLKIDVEGWEIEVLRGASTFLSSSRAPILCIEHSVPLCGTKGAIFDFILDINHYQVFRLKRGKENPSRLLRVNGRADLPNHDNIFCFLPEHLASLPRRMFV